MIIRKPLFLLFRFWVLRGFVWVMILFLRRQKSMALVPTRNLADSVFSCFDGAKVHIKKGEMTKHKGEKRLCDRLSPKGDRTAYPTPLWYVSANLRLCQFFTTEIRGTPSTEEIRANVESVKFCPPPIHRVTAAGDVPTFLANSLLDIPNSCRRLYITSEMPYIQSICVLTSWGVFATTSWKCLAPLTSFFIYHTLCRRLQ